MKTFGISKSTALRDIEALEHLGVPLYGEWSLWWLSSFKQTVVAADLF